MDEIFGFGESFRLVLEEILRPRIIVRSGIKHRGYIGVQFNSPTQPVNFHRRILKPNKRK